jgi:hypothetical protein
MGNKNKEYTNISRNNLALGKRLFIKAFYKYSFSGDTFNIIKEANKLI